MRVLCSMICALFLVAPALAADQVNADLVGLWAGRIDFTPRLDGPLEIARAGKEWRASAGGLEAAGRVDGASLRFDFLDGAGSFRGTLSEKSRKIRGFWLSAPGRADGRADPSAGGQPFAAPMVLKKVGANRWRGVIHPLPEHFTLYMKVAEGEDGALSAVFRNPEANSTGRARFLLRRDGDQIEIGVADDKGAFRKRGEAKLLHAPDSISLFWPDINGEITLRRADAQQAASFYPRPPDAPAYRYQKPPEAGDGWKTAPARDVGFDETALARTVQKIAETDPAAPRAPLIHSLLVARRGKLVLDEYFYGYDRDTPHDLRSASKTFSSVVLGAAMREGAPISPESKIYDLAADMGPFANPDPRKQEITLGELMTHTSGLACDDNDDASPGNEGTMQNQTSEPNWWKYALDLPMAHDPGEVYAYCSAGMNLMGAALTEATKSSIPALFERLIAKPLRFGRWYWNLMPTGEGYLGGGAQILPRDLLKIGEAYLDGGVWDGQRIVSADWVKESTAPKIDITPATTGLTPDEFSNSYIGGADGFAWHLNPVHSGGLTYAAYAAGGNGGQQLIVVPAFDLVVVLTGGNYGQGGVWLRWRDDIVGGEIIPALSKL
ncbi:MAG TPA: serine hydrolase [Parvularculaceae bacterium]|nr:serine hydrolase [Parvularculaceae bacterium]